VKHHRVEFPFSPWAHQKAAHAFRLVTRFLVLVWHRRAGKTVFAILELLLAAADCKREMGRFGYLAPLHKQAKSVVWDYLKRYARCIPGVVINESELQVELPNGSRVRLFGADNPDALRGLYFDGVVLDEVADMRPEVWGEIIRPALSDRQGWAIFIGTPKGVNLFSELYYRAQAEPGWTADLRRATDTGVIPPDELEQARREMSEAQFAQEYDCDFAAAAEDVLVRLDDVLAAQGRTLAEPEYIYAPKVLGVDVARYGGDRNVIFPRQGLVAFKPRILRGMDTMTMAGQVAHTIETWKPDVTFVDVGGIGAGVVDRLRQLKCQVVPVDFGSKATDGRYENKRAEMWWEMAAWVKAGACLPNLPELTQDLTAPRITYRNARGRMQLESKDDMRARGLPSTDVGDALATTFAFPVAPRASANPAGPQAAHEYNPLQGVM
jgi:hypothetical protein